jgi:hypothetical protein
MHYTTTRKLSSCASAWMLLLALTTATSLARAAVINVPAIEVQSLTHQFLPPSFPDPASARDNFTIGDGNYTGGGSFSIPTIQNGDTAVVRIQAPAGKKFVINSSSVDFGFNLFWQSSADMISLGGGSVAFENLVGTAPTNTYSNLGVGNAGNVIKAEMMYSTLSPIEFTALNITIPVLSSPLAGTRNFGSVQSNSSPSFYVILNTPTDQPVMTLQAIPEPSSLALIALSGMAAWGCFRRAPIRKQQ